MHSDSKGNTEVSINFADADGVRVYVSEELTQMVVSELTRVRDETT